MIILYEENEQSFSTLGLGVLKDVISCIVKEGLNDSYGLELVYPITGLNYSEIKMNRIIYVKSSPYHEAQPFRISLITKPINGKVTIVAEHISYDMNGIIDEAISGSNLVNTLYELEHKTLSDHKFKFHADKNSTKTFKTNAPYNMRALLMGSDESILETYELEVEFNLYDVFLKERRGSNKGACIRYSKNMTDLKHEISNENLYNGVYPYYHSESSSTETTTVNDSFIKAYIVGKNNYQDGWLSYTADGEPYHPIDESPVQIATEGKFQNKVFCWSNSAKRYIEKKYDEMVTIIEGVTSPTWLKIDFSKFPMVACRANVDGYFKTTSDTEYKEYKKGDVIFDGSIIGGGLLNNLIIYYAEVIPQTTTSTVEENVSVTHIDLKDKIIWIDTTIAKNMKHNRILNLDLTSEFEDEPSEEELKKKAEEYIKKNKIGTYKFNTEVSFVDLSSTTEDIKYYNLDNIELGDTIRIIYEKLDIDVELRVISTEYDAITNKFTSIELGEKSDTMSGSSVQTGDNVSSLSNDKGYTDTGDVNRIVTNIVTAKYIQAMNAKLSKAQIEQLESIRIKCTGILEASQAEIDTLVARMLTADNAKIKGVLESGEIKVAGDITVTSGEIKIQNESEGTAFIVDRDGNLTANSVAITGGTLNINNNFIVTNDGVMTAKGASIEGNISALAGLIGGFTIEDETLYNGDITSWDEDFADDAEGIFLCKDGIRIGPWLKIDKIGRLASGVASEIVPSEPFIVDKNGYLHARGVTIEGAITATSGYIAGFEIKTFDSSDTAICFGAPGTAGDSVLMSPGYEATIPNLDSNSHYWTFLSGVNFGVDTDGNLYAKNAKISGNISADSGEIGSFTITDGNLYYSSDSTYFVELGTRGLRIQNLSTTDIKGITFYGVSNNTTTFTAGFARVTSSSDDIHYATRLQYTGIVHDPDAGALIQYAIKAGQINIRGQEYKTITINNCSSITAVVCTKATVVNSYFNRSHGYYVEMDDTRHIAYVYIGSNTSTGDDVNISYIILYEPWYDAYD